MRENRSKKEIQKEALFRRRIFVLLGLLSLGYLLLSLFFGDMGVLRHRGMLRVYREAQEERERLLVENQRLRGEIQAFRRDPAMIERAARERLRMIRPGEIVYRFYGKEN
jgi:cell division protein FtsB